MFFHCYLIGFLNMLEHLFIPVTMYNFFIAKVRSVPKDKIFAYCIVALCTLCTIYHNI